MSLGWKLLALGLVIAAAIFGFVRYTDSLVAEGDAAGYERAQNEYRTRENEALKKAIEDRDRLANKLEGVSNEARKKTVALATAQRDTAAAGERLRNAIAALSRSPSCAGAAAGGGASADAPARVLADVQRRLDEATDRVAGFADASHIAGTACERAADAVK